jgi:hypothetical protein
VPGLRLNLTVTTYPIPSFSTTMNNSPRPFIKPRSASNQKARRRRETLFKKLSEYSSECAADIHLSIRMKGSGQIYTLVTNLEGWPLSQDQLVSLIIHWLSEIDLLPCSHRLFSRNYNTPSQSIRACQTPWNKMIKGGIKLAERRNPRAYKWISSAGLYNRNICSNMMPRAEVGGIYS